MLTRRDGRPVTPLDDQALVIGYGDKVLIGVFGYRDLPVTDPGRIAV